MVMKLRPVFNWLDSLPVLGPVFFKYRFPLKRAYFYYFQPESRKFWYNRIRDVMSCPDNQMIPRVPQAGQMVGEYQIMHNGLRILPGSYYGEGIRLMLEKNHGVHEPQEERAFGEILKYMPEEATMIELGAYWGFYSMWFYQMVRKPTCFLVEPDISNLRYGAKNFALNHMQGTFIQAFIGASMGKPQGGIAILTMDDLITQQKIDRVNILHADIQESELAMLQGARRALAAGQIDFIFLSTHTDELHRQCLAFLREHDYMTLAEVDISGSFAVDGLIVARRKNLPGPTTIPISRNNG